MGIVDQLVPSCKQLPVTEVYRDRYDCHRMTSPCMPTLSPPLFVQRYTYFDRPCAFATSYNSSVSVQTKSKGWSRVAAGHTSPRFRATHGAKRGKVVNCYFVNVSRCLKRYETEVERDEPSTSSGQFQKKRIASATIATDSTRRGASNRTR